MIDIASFYRFVDVDNPREVQKNLEDECIRRSLLGTILVASEGVNGTLAGNAATIREVWAWLEATLSLSSPISGRWSRASAAPFRRMRVREKREIVALGMPDIRPQAGTGNHVGPEAWNALLDRPETLVIDTRNRYEVEVGQFPNALNPQTDSFREFAAFAEALAADEDGEAGNLGRPVAMYCTGGIRCEKAAALMQRLGFEDVNQLDGGILNYLESMPTDDNRWEGECFVFDTRVAVDRDLAEGGYVQCHACRRPLSEEDLASPDYREGVSCPRCIDSLMPERAERLEERRKQVRLAEQRGTQHIGAAESGNRRSKPVRRS